MKLTARSSLAEVAILVGDALRRAGIHAVLTGGACASLYSAGRHEFVDVDFVLATDSCRDRLAAFYHWNDRQSLAVAVAIALKHRVSLRKIREWSARAGHEQGYAAFLAELQRGRRSAGRR